MSNEIDWRETITGATVYCTIRSSARTYWNGSGLEALTVANWATYKIALTETPAGGYLYVGDWPAALTTAGKYTLEIFQQLAGGANIADTLLATLVGFWNGTALALAVVPTTVVVTGDSVTSE